MINFAIEKSVILIQSKKGCLNDFGFLYFAIQKHIWTWVHINLARFAPYAPLPIRARSVDLLTWSSCVDTLIVYRHNYHIIDRVTKHDHNMYLLIIIMHTCIITVETIILHSSLVLPSCQCDIIIIMHYWQDDKTWPLFP